MYNIHNYIAERKKRVTMTIDAVLQAIKGTKEFELLSAAHKSVTRVKEEPFYIGTQFNQIKSNLNPRFVLVSAPGATGKSAFGKYVACKRNGLYWNLAELNIGDGTFQGTLYKALGVSKISGYAQDLQNGNATLVIDAFDEAEIISGRKNVEIFLTEANEFLEESTVPSIVLLSRTETAQNIAVFFKTNKIPYIHYEIGYFPETQAREFVLKTAEKRKTITPAVEECVDQYFKQVRTLVHDKNIVEKFLGYAPVLEAIAAHIAEISNTAKLLSELREGSTEVSLIHSIMDNLLEREKEKFVSAFRVRLGEDQNKVQNWENVYSKEEQLVRVLNFILFGETSSADYPTEAIPSHFLDEYNEVIARFLPQHPFVQNCFADQNGVDAKMDFAGPAFRDYGLAYLILNDDFEASAELYYQGEKSDAHFPSQLFWNHYIDLNQGHLKSKHFVYLMEAYKSKISVGNQAYLDLYQDSDGAVATFRIEKAKEIIDSATLDVDVSPEGFVFGNISNTSIDVAGTVVLDQKDNLHLTDSTIMCETLVVNANSLHVSSYSPCTTTICSNQPMRARPGAPLNIQLSGDGEIQVDIPNIYEFPKLSRFKYSFAEANDLDIYVFVHCLRKIFSSFRTHKKDMPARDAEKIDFVVIGDNPLRKSLFEFLTHKKIVFKDAHLYKIDVEKMSAAGINWGAITSTDLKQLRGVYDEFVAWKE